MRTALIVVDMQRDFLPGGALAVSCGDEIIPMLNEYIRLFDAGKELVVFTRDWHPEGHSSFVTHGGTWPVHCVRGARGAEIDDRLEFPSTCLLVSKAILQEKEAYSAFDGTRLAEYLVDLGVDQVFVGGVATDYCVKSTVLGGVANGFEVFLLKDAIRGVDLKQGDSARAVEEMRKGGARLVTIDEVKVLLSDLRPEWSR
jgi:nicotinamidase/pyrazinamidase